MAKRKVKKKKAAKTYSLAQMKVFGLGIGIFTAVLISIFGFLGWNTSNEPEKQADTSSSPPRSTVSAQGVNDLVVGTAVGQRAPDFNLLTVDDQNYQIQDSFGAPTILYFSSTTCVSCIPKTQALAKLKETFDERLNVLWIDVDLNDSKQSLREFGMKYGHSNFVYAFDKPSNRAAISYQVRALGTLYLLDQQGIVQLSGVNPMGTTQFNSLLEKLIGV